MTWDDAIKISIQRYFSKGDDDLEYGKMEKDRKYTKSYFDSFEEERKNSKSSEKADKTSTKKVDSTKHTEKFNEKIS